TTAAPLAPALTLPTEHAVRALTARKYVPVLLKHPQRRVTIPARTLVDAVRGEASTATAIDATPPRRRRSRHLVPTPATLRILDLENVGTIPDRLRTILTEQPRLIRLREGVEVVVRIRDEPLVARPLTRLRRDVGTVAARMTEEPVIPSIPATGQNRAPRAGRRIQHPHIPAREVRSVTSRRSLAPRVRHHARYDLRELVPSAPQRLSRKRATLNRLLRPDRRHIQRRHQVATIGRIPRKRLRISERDRQLILPRLHAHATISPQR